jgi:hypothetical protein
MYTRDRSKRCIKHRGYTVSQVCCSLRVRANLKPLHGSNHRLGLHTLPLQKIRTSFNRFIQLQQEAFVSLVNNHVSDNKNQQIKELEYLSNEFRKTRFMEKVGRLQGLVDCHTTSIPCFHAYDQEPMFTKTVHKVSTT